MNKFLKLNSLFLISSLLLVQVAMAAPLISSADNQNFSRNQGSTQLRDITVTQEGEDAFIEEGYLKIILPDSIAVIFDDERTLDELVVYGSAVDNGRLSATPNIHFSDSDKELWIPIDESFQDGEYLVVTKAFVEGFNSASVESGHMTLQINDEAVSYTNSKTLYVTTSSTEDSHAPELVSDIVLENTADGVMITWLDPTDLDLQSVEILRGANGLPVSGSYFGLVASGIEYFVDDQVAEGDELTYILRAYDGRNYSANSSEYSITYSVPVELVCDEGYVEVDGECVLIEITLICEEGYEEVDGECVLPAPEEDPIEEVTEETILFSDTEGHWGELVIADMAGLGIIEGDPEGTFRPNDSLNRAEAATLIHRILSLVIELEALPVDSEMSFEALPEDYVNPFSDLSEEDWYFDIVLDLESFDLVEGNPDGTFEPAESINRAEFMQMAYNAYLATVVEHHGDVDPYHYIDVNSDDWFYAAVAYAYVEGWASGYECDEGACFKPAEAITRAEAAQILYNMFYEQLAQ